MSSTLILYTKYTLYQAPPHPLSLQLEEDGVVFFRESCFRQSGDKKRANNPTHYRNPREYFRVFDCVSNTLPDGRVAHFELISCKCVDTYVRVKHNQNQVCWKWRKVGSWVVLVVGLIVLCMVLLMAVHMGFAHGCAHGFCSWLCTWVLLIVVHMGFAHSCVRACHLCAYFTHPCFHTNPGHFCSSTHHQLPCPTRLPTVHQFRDFEVRTHLWSRFRLHRWPRHHS